MHQINAHSSVTIGSERSFGFVFAAVFTAVAAWPLLGGQDPRWTAFGLACVFAVIALRHPAILKPLNHGWFKFALGLSRITTPIVMGFLFFAVVCRPASSCGCTARISCASTLIATRLPTG
jgi:hypothetical protein